MSGFPPGLEPVKDLSPASWLRETLSDWPTGRPFIVGDLVPPVFDAYARILHRVWQPDDVREPNGTWSELARARGVSMISGTAWEALEIRHGGKWRVDEGSLSEGEVEALVRLLGTESDSTACWFALWSGYASIFEPGATLFLEGGSPKQRLAIRIARTRERIATSRVRRAARRLPTFDLLGRSRSYLLFEGPLGNALAIHHLLRFQSPNLWWPDDRSWFVHSEIDSTSTYLGGSRGLIGRLVGEQVLESFEVEADTPAAL
jgi:hypothetical protein